MQMCQRGALERVGICHAVPSRQLARMRQVMIQAIAPLPSHGDYLRQLTKGAAAA